MLEHKVLNTADTIIVTSKTTKGVWSHYSKPIAVITNGYDVEKIETQPLDTKFSLAHMVLFFQSEILWFYGNLVELISEVPDFKSHLEIKLIGAVSQEVLETISNLDWILIWII
jgi:hypothetical protein